MSQKSSTMADSRDTVGGQDAFRREFARLPALIRSLAPADTQRAVAITERDTVLTDFLHARHTSEDDRSEMPAEVQARLIADIAALQRDVLAPLGLTACGLYDREVDVLRYIADGLDTAEIAQKMLYSERTVKGILYGLMPRLHLRNRSQAVAYARRAGVL